VSEGQEHHHEWEAANDGWGVILGVSRCKTCGKVATESDFRMRVGAAPGERAGQEEE
jgi:hypothetical protein